MFTEEIVLQLYFLSFPKKVCIFVYVTMYEGHPINRENFVII